MSTFITSLILILIGFAMFYPFFFKLIDRSIQNAKGARRFLQLNYLLHLIAGSVAVLLLWIYGVNYPLQLSGIVYLIVIVVVVLYYWKPPIPQWNLFSASIVFGFIVFYRSIKEIVEITPLWPGIFTGVLAAGAISIVSYLLVSTLHSLTRNNTNNFLIKYLFLIIGIRIAWDIVILFNLSVETRNSEIVSALSFFWQADSLKLILIILSGFVIPILLYFPFRMNLSKPNSKIRILMLLLLFASVWTAEFLYKYFLLQYGIVL